MKFSSFAMFAGRLSLNLLRMGLEKLNLSATLILTHLILKLKKKEKLFKYVNKNTCYMKYSAEKAQEDNIHLNFSAI